MKKLVTNNSVHMPPLLVTRNDTVLGAVEIVCIFLGRFCMYLLERFLLRGSNAKKWGDHRKKKFFINDALIRLKVYIRFYCSWMYLWGREEVVPAWGNNKASKRLKNLLVLEQKRERWIFRTY